MRKLTNREIIMLSVLGVLGIGAWYVLLVMMPLTAEIESMKTDTQGLEITLQDAEEKYAISLAYSKDIGTYEGMWKEIDGRLPTRVNDTDIINMMVATRQAMRINSQDLSYQFGRVDVADANLSIITVDVALVASYADILKFMDTFTEDEKSVCRVTGISMTPDTSVENSTRIVSEFKIEMLYKNMDII